MPAPSPLVVVDRPTIVQVFSQVEKTIEEVLPLVALRMRVYLLPSFADEEETRCSEKLSSAGRAHSSETPSTYPDRGVAHPTSTSSQASHLRLSVAQDQPRV